LSVNAAIPENQERAYLIRLRDAMNDKGVPEGLQRRVREYVEAETHPRARTLVLFAAEDGLFPPQFAKVHGKRKTPVFGLVVSSVLVSALMLMNYTKGLVGAFEFVILLATLTGAAEVALGTGLLVGRWQPAVLAGLAIQLTGTFLVLVLRPDVAFVDGNLLVLSASGEYVVKNIVLLAATLTLAGGRPPQRPAASRPRGARPPARVSSDLESLGGTGS
jgi:hypothetical protein